MKVLVPLAEGFEEIETMTIIDVLRRAGIDVTTCGLPGTIVNGSKGVKIIADRKLEDIDPEEFDVLVLPGGSPGYINLGKSQKIVQTIRNFNSKKKLIAAICGSPSILANEGVLNDKRATIYPGLERMLPKPRDEKVVLDENIITSKGPGTSIEFTLKIIEVLLGEQKMMQIRRELVC